MCLPSLSMLPAQRDEDIDSFVQENAVSKKSAEVHRDDMS